MTQRRIAACMLTLCLVLGCLPGTALAEDVTAQAAGLAVFALNSEVGTPLCGKYVFAPSPEAKSE